MVRFKYVYYLILYSVASPPLTLPTYPLSHYIMCIVGCVVWRHPVATLNTWLPMPDLEQWCPKSAKEGWVEFPLSTFCVLTKHSPVSKALLRSIWHCSVSLLMCFVWQPPSNSLFVAVTDYRTLLFCFDSTRHRFYGTFRRLKVGGRGTYTYYVIVSKETSLGIAGLNPAYTDTLSLIAYFSVIYISINALFDSLSCK